MRIKPARKGEVVIDPATGVRVPDEGLTTERTASVARMIANGAVVEIKSERRSTAKTKDDADA